MAKKQKQPLPQPIRDIHAPAAAAERRSFGLSRLRLPAKLRQHLRRPKVRLALLIAAVLIGGLFVRTYVQTRNNLEDEATRLAADIGRHLELPADETPTLATVKDAAKLKAQPFFIRAENGDKVLLYTQSGRAVLYRPATKKVIEYYPISLTDHASGI